MDAQQFLAEFGHIANAPAGVPVLRQMIYQLAICGALTQRSGVSDDARVLLATVDATRQRLIRERKYKRMLELEGEPARTPSGITLPRNWCWTRLLDMGEINPRNDAMDDEVAAFVSMSGVSQIHRGAIVADSVRWAEVKKGYTHFANGDVVLAKITPCFENGKAAVIKGLPTPSGIGAGSTEFHVFRPIHRGILSEYVYLFLRSPHFWMDGEKRMTGTAGQKRLPTDYFATRAFPLAPTEEQACIVAKVDELMALCDRLEEQQQARRTLQNTLRQSTMQAVATATSPHELQTTWTRLADNFSRLFREPEDMASLRGMILDLAMSGQFLNSTTQAKSSGDALLKEIAEARVTWSKLGEGQEQKEAASMLGKLRTQKVSFPDSSLPKHWAWGSFLQIAQVVVDCHNKTAPYVAHGVHLIRTTDIRNGRMTLARTRKISEETYAYWSRRMPPKPGDVFFTREAPMGEAAIVPEGERVCLGQRTMLLRLFPKLFNNKFLLYAIQSPSFQKRMGESAIGMTVKHLRVGGVEDLLVPVPPKEEQDRIVSLVDALFKVCDQLSERLTSKLAVAQHLAAFTAAAVTGITREQEQDEPMKVPQTELVAPLRLGQTPNAKAQAPLATILLRHQGEMSAKDLRQQFGGEIDAFYAQLKMEVTQGWIAEPRAAEMRVNETVQENA